MSVFDLAVIWHDGLCKADHGEYSMCLFYRVPWAEEPKASYLRASILLMRSMPEIPWRQVGRQLGHA